MNSRLDNFKLGLVVEGGGMRGAVSGGGLQALHDLGLRCESCPLSDDSTIPQTARCLHRPIFSFCCQIQERKPDSLS